MMLIWSNMDLISGWGWLFVMQKRIVGVCGVLDSKAAERSLRVAQWEGHPLLCFPAVTCVSGRTRLNFSLILPPGMGGGRPHTFPPGIIKLPFLFTLFFSQSTHCVVMELSFLSPQHKKMRDGRYATW